MFMGMYEIQVLQFKKTLAITSGLLKKLSKQIEQKKYEFLILTYAFTIKIIKKNIADSR